MALGGAAGGCSISKKVVEKKILTARECASAHVAVHELRRYWRAFGLAQPHFGLGAWKYQDTAAGLRRYGEQARKHNSILRENLGWLYDVLAKELSVLLGAPASYERRMSLPGVSIHLPSRSRKGEPLGVFHYDKAKEARWPAPKRPTEEFITYILPIAIPTAGAGLDIWKIDADAYAKLPPTRQAFERAFGYYTHSYSRGSLLLLRGYVLHRPAGTNAFPRSQERVTVQGHGMKRRGKWLLYL